MLQSAHHRALGVEIRELRKQRGISQEKLGDRSYMGGVERGERNVSLTNILKVASALEVPTTELFGRFEARRTGH